LVYEHDANFGSRLFTFSTLFLNLMLLNLIIESHHMRLKHFTEFCWIQMWVWVYTLCTWYCSVISWPTKAMSTISGVVEKILYLS